MAGQPAITHVAAALRRGRHVITANKGPVAHAAGRLRALARRSGVRFLHEGVVMDGFPIFNLAERCLRGARVRGFRGVLNSTTTRILSRMEVGVPFDVALAEAQAAGVAEADPSFDLDGWDAAVKACALANALMGASLRPADVERVSVRGVSAEAVARAALEGKRWRLVVRAGRDGRRVHASVGPEELPLGDLLVSGGRRRRAGARHRPDGRGGALGGTGRRGPDRLRGALRPARGGEATGGAPAEVMVSRDGYVTIAALLQPEEAGMARALLESSGIEALLEDEALSSIDPLVRFAIGGTKLLVRREDAVRARALLDDRGVLTPAGDRTAAEVEIPEEEWSAPPPEPPPADPAAPRWPAGRVFAVLVLCAAVIALLGEARRPHWPPWAP